MDLIFNICGGFEFTDWTENKIPSSIKTKLRDLVSLLSRNTLKDRQVLINLSDDLLFQFQTLYPIVNNSYCVYNIKTNKIAFGNTLSGAINETTNYNYINNLTWFSTMMIPSTTPMFTFDEFYVEVLNDEPYHFCVSDNFYDQIYNEIYKYVIFEKQQSFLEVTDYLISVKDIIMNYFDHELEISTIIPRSTILTKNFYNTFYSFINDDKDILLLKNRYPNNFEILKKILCKLQLITGETIL